MVIVSLVIAIAVNWNDTLGIGGKGGFEFIQKYTGYISPAIFPVFLFGFFWKKTTSNAAISGIIGGVVLAILFDKFHIMRHLGEALDTVRKAEYARLSGKERHETWLYTAYLNGDGVYEIPFLIQMGWVFFFTTILIVAVSLLDVKGRANVKALEVDTTMYKISKGHWAMIIIILLLVAVIYARFW